MTIEVKNCITLIIGPNGSGKSTFINTVTGFLNADSGKFFFEGREITNLPPHKIFKQGIVRTFQTSQPLLKLTVLENLLIAEANYGESLFQSFSRSWLANEDTACKASIFDPGIFRA